MKAASSADIKQELKQRSPNELVEVCLRLARFKKENKELLTYILFESDDRESYINSVKNEMDTGFAEVNKASLYYVKKSLRKILRNTSKFIRYSGDGVVETELLLHFAELMKGLDISWRRSVMIMKLYTGVIKKIEASVDSLHEDLQYDYLKRLQLLLE